jgi:hypothetical protein
MSQYKFLFAGFSFSVLAIGAVSQLPFKRASGFYSTGKNERITVVLPGEERILIRPQSLLKVLEHPTALQVHVGAVEIETNRGSDLPINVLGKEIRLRGVGLSVIDEQGQLRIALGGARCADGASVSEGVYRIDGEGRCLPKPVFVRVMTPQERKIVLWSTGVPPEGAPVRVDALVEGQAAKNAAWTTDLQKPDGTTIANRGIGPTISELYYLGEGVHTLDIKLGDIDRWVGDMELVTLRVPAPLEPSKTRVVLPPSGRMKVTFAWSGDPRVSLYEVRIADKDNPSSARVAQVAFHQASLEISKPGGYEWAVRGFHPQIGWSLWQSADLTVIPAEIAAH